MAVTCYETGVRVPRMNAIIKRWVQSCRHELLDRTLIWNERHLRHALHQYEQFYNTHRSHQAMMQAAPLRAVPHLSRIEDESPTWTYAADTDSAVSSTNTNMPLELHGRGIRQAQCSTPAGADSPHEPKTANQLRTNR